jgi:acetamidase/formamidase
MTLHHLGPDPESVIDVYTYQTPPALTINPGDTVIVGSLDSAGHLERQRTPGEQRPLMFPQRRGHCLTGPIAVRGALPGQLLAVRFDAMRPDVWGFTRAGGRDDGWNRMLGTAQGEPAFLLWELDADAGVGINQFGLRVPLAPFLGVTGLAPDEPGTHSTIPPRTRGGGNIDCRELIAGSTLFLPVTVPEAYLFVGDGHAAQGDGEVGGTAIECGMTTRLTVTLLDRTPVASVHAITPTARITFGFDADLNAATGDALSAMLTWMQVLFELDRSMALATASTTVDLRITQIANESWGVHAVLPLSVSPA